MNFLKYFKKIFTKKKEADEGFVLKIENENSFYLDLADELYLKTHGVTLNEIGVYVDTQGRAFLNTKKYPIKKDVFVEFVDDVIVDNLMSEDEIYNFKVLFLMNTQPNLI